MLKQQITGRFFSVHEFETNLSLTQKDIMDGRNHTRFYKWRNLSRKTQKENFVHKRSMRGILIAWEWGTNEYICLTLLWSCGDISSGNLKMEVKLIPYVVPRRVTKTSSCGYPTPEKVTNNMMQEGYIPGQSLAF